MRWYERIIGAITSVTDQVSHGTHIRSDRFFVWQEDAGADFVAGNRHTEKAMTGTIDLFSKTEFDPWVDQLEQALNDGEIAWRLNSVQFEPETDLWHWEWKWGARDGKN